MSDTCEKHSFELAVGVCRQCRNSYCGECLIYAFGEKKPPYCVTCALNVAGVRQQGAKPNRRLRRKGLFGRKVVAEEEPKKELGFDDVKIELPEEAYSAPVMTRSTRTEIAPEILTMVQSAESGHEPFGDGEAGTVAVAAPADGSGGTLDDWAASLTPDDAVRSERRDEPRREASLDAWPEDSIGRSF